MRKNFWADAARRGATIGVVVSLLAMARVWLPVNGTLLSAIELVAMGYCIYVFGVARRNAHDEGRYGQVISFVMAEMVCAGVIYGAVLYLLANHWAVDYYARQMAETYRLLRESGAEAVFNAEAEQQSRNIAANPLGLVASGVLGMVLYGGLVGIFVGAFIRRRGA